MRVRPSLLFALLAASAAPAVGETCPGGPAAVDTGITISFPQVQVDYRRGPDGRIRETERDLNEGTIWHYISDPIGAVFESWESDLAGRIDETTRDRFSYAFTDGFPRGVPGGVWVGTETVTTSAGEVFDAVVTWRMGAVEQMQIGNCSYAAIEIYETRMDLPKEPGDLPWINRYTHLPELGLSLYLGGDEVGLDPVLDTPLSIQASVP